MCFFLETIKRWQKIKTPPSDAFLNIISKAVGRIVDTNYLTFRILDLIYLPRSALAITIPTPTVISFFKRSNHWEDRTDPSTPFKRLHFSDPAYETANPLK